MARSLSLMNRLELHIKYFLSNQCFDLYTFDPAIGYDYSVTLFLYNLQRF